MFEQSGIQICWSDSICNEVKVHLISKVFASWDWVSYCREVKYICAWVYSYTIECTFIKGNEDKPKETQSLIISSNKKYGNSTSLFTSCLANCILLWNKINMIFNFIHSAFRIRITFCWRSSTAFMMWMKLNRGIKRKITSLWKTLQLKWDFMYKYSFEESFLNAYLHEMRIHSLSLLFFRLQILTAKSQVWSFALYLTAILKLL